MPFFPVDDMSLIHSVAERFELYIAGLELANGFSELVDPNEQAQRFNAEVALIEAQGRVPAPLPEQFLADLQNVPSASAGIALGLDRLCMSFLGPEHINDVVAFVPGDW